MLQLKTLKHLTLITFVVGLGIYVASMQQGVLPTWGKQEKFLFPELLGLADEVETVEVKGLQQTISLKRGESQWLWLEKNGYPVLSNKVSDIVFGMADAKIIEPKTENPANYSQIDVNDVTEPDARSIQVVLKDKDDNEISNVIIGKRSTLQLSDGEVDQIFVRKSNERRSWLVQSRLPISLDMREWIKQPLFSMVNADNIKSIELEQADIDAMPIVLQRQDRSQPDFQFKSYQGEYKLDQMAVNELPSDVAMLEIEDVISSKDMDVEWEQGISVSMETFDGIDVTIDLLEVDGKVLGKAIATLALGESEVSDAAAFSALKEKVNAFNSMAKQWYFEVSKDAYKEISSKTEEDLIQKS